MNKIAIIGASYLQKPLVEKAKLMGIETHVFAWEEGAVCKEIADKFYPVSVLEKEEILEICRHIKPDGVISIASDAAMPTVTYVSENLGLISNSEYSTLLTTNKRQMKEILKEHEIECAPFIHIGQPYSLEAITSQIKFPCIVKPTDRSGSKGVNLAMNEDELLNAITISQADSFEKKCMIESYLEGSEISVEMISWRGTHYPLAVTDKTTTGPPHFVETGHRQPSKLPKALLERVNTIVKQALTALEVQYGASHTELIITSDAKIYVNEVAGRMGGDFIGSDLVKLSTGYDFLEGTINICLGKFSEPRQSINQTAEILFLSEENQEVFYKAELNEQNIIKKEIINPKAIKLSSSADRGGFIIYCKP